MRLFTLFLLATLVATSAHAASYFNRDGVTIDPIQTRWGGDLLLIGILISHESTGKSR
jgi:hypothetical protein